MATGRLKKMQDAVSIANAGDIYEKTLLKATKHTKREQPEEKHVHFLVQGTRAQAPCQAILFSLNRRLQAHDYVAVLKALLVFHRLWREGTTDFLSLACTSQHQVGPRLVQLQSFSDTAHTSAHIQSAFIRKYAKYLEMSILTFQKFRLEVQRDHERARSWSLGEVLQRCPALLHYLAALIDTKMDRATIADNVVTAGAFGLCVADSLRIYSAINICIFALLDKHMSLTPPQLSAVIDMYRLFLRTHDNLAAMYKFAEGFVVKSLPKLKAVSAEPLVLLEQRLTALQSGAVEPEPVARAPQSQPAAQASSSATTTAAIAAELAAAPAPPATDPEVKTGVLIDLMGDVSLSSPAPSATSANASSHNGSSAAPVASSSAAAASDFSFGGDDFNPRAASTSASAAAASSSLFPEASFNPFASGAPPPADMASFMPASAASGGSSSLAPASSGARMPSPFESPAGGGSAFSEPSFSPSPVLVASPFDGPSGAQPSFSPAVASDPFGGAVVSQPSLLPSHAATDSSSGAPGTDPFGMTPFTSSSSSSSSMMSTTSAPVVASPFASAGGGDPFAASSAAPATSSAADHPFGGSSALPATSSQPSMFGSSTATPTPLASVVPSFQPTSVPPPSTAASSAGTGAAPFIDPSNPFADMGAFAPPPASAATTSSSNHAAAPVDAGNPFGNPF